MGKGDTQEAAPPTSTYRSIMEEYGYEVGKVIGNGSYGTVYEAYYTKQKVKVAIKIISKKKASEDYLNKFLPREIQVPCSLPVWHNERLSQDLSLPCLRTWSSRCYAKPPSVPPSWTSSRIPGY